MNYDKLPSLGVLLPKIHSGPIYTVKFNASGEYCMAGSQDRSVSLYNPSKGLLVKQYKNIHNYDVYSLAIYPDNSKFVTGGGDRNVIVTDVSTGKTVRKFTGHSSRVNAVACTPDCGLLASASYDTTVRCWDNRNNSYHPIEILKGFKDSVTQVHFCKFQIICSSMDGSMRFYDVRMGQITNDAVGHPVQRFAMANSAEAYAVSTVSDTIVLVESKTGRKIQSYTGHRVKDYTVDLAFNAKDTHIVTGGENGQLYIYDIMKENPVKVIPAHTKVLSAVDVHQIGGYVTASHDATVSYWKI